MQLVWRTVRTAGARSRHWETLQIAVLLLALLVAFFSRAIFHGRKLVPADIAYTDPVYVGHAPAEFTTPHNILLYDQAYQFYPWRVYVTRALREGALPLWNPYVYCGAPFMAEDQPAVLYPPNVLSYVLSPPDALLFTAVLRLWIAGLATYWFLRALGANSFGALTGSVTFTFSGFMIVWLGHPHTNVAAWLPAFFLTLEWLHQRVSLRHTAFVAVVIAAQLLGGHAETALYTLTAGGLYYLFRTATSWSSGREGRLALSRLLSLAAAAILGAALAAAHLLPFLEWLRLSAELEVRSGVGGLRATSLGPKYWLAGIAPMLLPNVFSNPTWPGEYRSFFPGWNFVEHTLYVGVVGLALAFVAVIAGRDRRVWFWAALGLVALGAALRFPIFDLVNQLPLFSISAYGRLRLVYTFCVSVLAGLGAHEVVEHSEPRRILRPLIVCLAGLVVVGLAVMLAMPDILSELNLQAGMPRIRQLSPDALSSAFRLSNMEMSWPLLAACAASLIFAYYLRSRASLHVGGEVVHRRSVECVVVLLIITDLFALGMGYHSAMPEEEIFPDTPTLQMIKSDPGVYRVVGTHVDLMPNACMVHGFQDVRGLDFPASRYRDLCLAIGGEDWLGYGLLFSEELRPELLGLLNVKYILTSSQLTAETQKHLSLLGTDKGIQVYENLSCLPRAFIVRRVRVSEESEDLLRTLLDTEFDVRSEIILEKPPPADFSNLRDMPSAMSEGDQSMGASAEITRYEPNYVQIQADTALNGFLFLSDTAYPGWKAYIDGVEAEIFRADYAFRAVYLTAGRHTVEFAYRPLSFRLGAAISLAALLVVLVLVASPRMARARDAARANGQGNVDDGR